MPTLEWWITFIICFMGLFISLLYITFCHALEQCTWRNYAFGVFAVVISLLLVYGTYLVKPFKLCFPS